MPEINSSLRINEGIPNNPDTPLNSLGAGIGKQGKKLKAKMAETLDEQKRGN